MYLSLLEKKDNTCDVFIKRLKTTRLELQKHEESTSNICWIRSCMHVHHLTNDRALCQVPLHLVRYWRSIRR